VVLAIEPAATTATVNSAFSLDIQVRGGSYQVTGVSACLSFDPAHLHVVDSSCNETDVLTPGGALPRAMRNSADNALGRIEFEAAMGLGGTLAGGTFSQPHAQVVPHSGSSPGLRQLTGTATPHLTAQWVARSW